MSDEVRGADGSNEEETRLSIDDAAEAFAGMLSDDELDFIEPEEGSDSGDGEESESEEEEGEDIPESEETEESEEEDFEEAEDEEESDEGDEYEDAEDEIDLADYVVEVPDGKGGTEDISVEEARLGYMRQADYTRKTQALAEERKSFENEAEETRKVREDYRQRLEAITKMVDSDEEAPNWNKLRSSLTWQEYEAQKEAWDKKQQARAALKAEVERVNDEVDTDREERLKALAKQEREALLKELPDFADEAKRSELMTLLTDYAVGVRGFTKEELGSVIDHRLLLMLRDAALYHKGAKTVSKKKVRKKPKVLKPGTPQRKAKATAKRKRTDAKVRKLRRTGRVDDAAAAIETMLDDI